MLVDSSQCCGCGSCAASCPESCITMEYDGEGFRYPHVDPAQCIHCRACEKTCPVMNPPSPADSPKAIAAQNQDGHIRASSSSGGIFFALAENTIRSGGLVCAAVYDEDFSVTHILADTLQDAARQRGAKYPQSSVEHCFAEIRRALRSGTPVMFVGTPCQTAGLRAFLGRDDANLLLVDMICHGVVSPKVWARYLDERQLLDAGKAPVASVNLRSKATGWSHYQYSVSINYANGASYQACQSKDPLMQGFTQNLYLRRSCSQCVFKGTKRCADLTLGDYWGIWDQNPEFDDNQGTSLLLIHTPKGQEAWDTISGQFRFLETTYQEAVSRNPSAAASSVPHGARDKFFRNLDREKSMIQWITQCLGGGKLGLIQRIRNRLGV